MPAVNDVGEPCAGEPHARFDGRGLETEARNLTTVTGVAQPTGKPAEHRPQALPQEKPPRQPPTLRDACGLDSQVGGGELSMARRSSAEARSNVAGEHVYQHFMIIFSPRGVSGRAVRLGSGP